MGGPPWGDGADVEPGEVVGETAVAPVGASESEVECSVGVEVGTDVDPGEVVGEATLAPVGACVSDVE